MAIDAVGSKIMIHKATEFARDASAAQRQAELTQADANQRMKAQSQMDNTQVTDVNQPSQVAIQRERERKQRRQEEELPRQSEGGSQEQRDDTKVVEERRKLDIRI